MSKDHNGNRPYKRAVLRDRGGDLSKEWYVEFYAWDEAKEDLVRKRIKIPTSFHTKKARVEEGNKIIAETNELLEKGFYFKKESITPDSSILSDSDNDLVLALESLIRILTPTLRPKSVITYQSAVNKLKKYSGEGGLLIHSFSDKDVVQFRDYMLATLGNTSRTANNTIHHLNTLYSHLEGRVDLPENPFKIKKLKQVATNKNIAFTDADRVLVENYMLEHAPELYLYTRFIYFAFIRPGELNLVKLADVRRAEQYIFVRGEISKNGKSESVPLIPPLLKAIETLDFDWYSQDMLLFSANLKPGRTVLGKQVPFRRHEKILKTLNLDKKGYTLYSWKHTGAVNAYLSGVGIKQLQSLLRHSSVQITDIYLKSLGLRTDPNIGSYNW